MRIAADPGVSGGFAIERPEGVDLLPMPDSILSSNGFKPRRQNRE